MDNDNVSAHSPPPSPDQTPEADERQLREDRILDAAAALLLRWGYRKTTIDDVAREAHVGKGTIYLHWKNKDQLFRAVIEREQRLASEVIQQRIAADPQGGLFHRLLSHAMVAGMERPLMAAMMKGQSELFHGFVGGYDRQALQQAAEHFETYIAQLQQAGLIRSDLSVQVIAFFLGALKMGLIYAPDLLGQAATPPIEQITEALSDLAQRWLEPAQLPDGSEQGKQYLSEYLKTVGHPDE